ncbi:hypothetical protein [Burkholderia plantarii]|uniref:hypothetical protein n=1 Tax=Burkholderia plantarii TaxID=41899 RepID=UPI00087085C5|nr:hypothetical protein [Burkholderia plantarii]
MNKRMTMTLACVAMFAGCGGGGDSGSTVVSGADAGSHAGSGPTQSGSTFTQMSGTQMIWEGAQPGPGPGYIGAERLRVSLDEHGVALASWQNTQTMQIMTSVTGADGQWSAATSLPGAIEWDSYAQRTNAAGQRVLLAARRDADSGGYHKVTFFYTPSIGWSDAVQLKRDPVGDFSKSDFTVADDGSALLAVNGYDLTSGMTNTEAPAEVYRLRPDGAQATGITTFRINDQGKPDPLAFTRVQDAVFVMPRQDSHDFKNQGYLFWREYGFSGAYSSGAPRRYFSLGAIGAVVSSPALHTSEARSLHVRNVDNDNAGNCWIEAKASNTRNATVIWGQGDGTGRCQLMATRISEDGGWHTRTDALGSNTIYFQAPKLWMDEAGNALVAWTFFDSSGPHYLWSQSLAGGAWSQPADLLTSLGVDSPAEFQIDFHGIEMNAAGEAVAAFSTRDPKVGGSAYSLAYARFDFLAGWQRGAVIASGRIASAFQAQSSVNRNGKATIVYSVTPCRPRPDQNSVGCDRETVYGYTF